jgi:hypothetical protein
MEKCKIMKLKTFLKKDLSTDHSDPSKPFIAKGEEVRIGKISDSLTGVMLIDIEDNRHIWIKMSEYAEYVEDELV